MRAIEMLKEKEMDYKPQATPAQIEHFMETVVYADFHNEILTRIEQMRDFYEDCPSKEYLETRGGIKLLRLVKDIFLNLRDNAIADLESKNEGEPEDD